jgi:hypothetical protein
MIKVSSTRWRIIFMVEIQNEKMKFNSLPVGAKTHLFCISV